MKAVKRIFGRKSKTRQETTTTSSSTPSGSSGSRIQLPRSSEPSIPHEEQPVLVVPVDSTAGRLSGRSSRYSASSSSSSFFPSTTSGGDVGVVEKDNNNSNTNTAQHPSRKKKKKNHRSRPAASTTVVTSDQSSSSNVAVVRTIETDNNNNSSNNNPPNRTFIPRERSARRSTTSTTRSSGTVAAFMCTSLESDNNNNNYMIEDDEPPLPTSLVVESKGPSIQQQHHHSTHPTTTTTTTTTTSSTTPPYDRDDDDNNDDDDGIDDMAQGDDGTDDVEIAGAVAPPPPTAIGGTNEGIHYGGGGGADTDDSDDGAAIAPAGLLAPSSSSERSSNNNNNNKYKGVSKSFKGLNMTEQLFGDVDIIVPREESLDNKLARVSESYDAIPLIEQTKLPRGGISMETKAVGRIQFGIPPETIKDSMRLGVPVPHVYIVPAERFCREMGPALGVNLAEFEFPAYFNFFVYKKQCTLVVDSQDAEDNICRVFEETLLGPKQFRRTGGDSIPYEEEDFAPDFPRNAIPNFEKELGFFRIMGDGSELTLDKLLTFCHFKQPRDGYSHDHLGVPPNLDSFNEHEVEELVHEVEELVQRHYEEDVDELVNVGGELGEVSLVDVAKDEEEIDGREEKANWFYGRARFVGDVATVWPTTATDEEKQNRSVPRVEIFKMPGGTEYIIHDVDKNNQIVGKARFSGHVKVSESMSVEGFGGQSILSDDNDIGQIRLSDGSYNMIESPVIPNAPPSFHPPSFGVTILGNSHGFDASGSVSGYVLWINGRGVMIDPPPYSSATLEREGIRPRTIVGIILTHTHADHDAGAFQKVLTGSPVVVITTPTIYKSFIRKYAALASLSPALLRHSHRYKAAIIGQPLRFQGATFHFFYSLHAIPCVGFRVEWRGRSMVFTGDHMNKPDSIDKLQQDGILSKARADDLRNMPLQETDLLLHEAGAPPIHTPLEVLQKLPQRVKKRMYVVHTSNIPKEFDLRVAPTGTAGTLRLDQLQRGRSGAMARVGVSTWMDRSLKKPITTRDAYSISMEDDEPISSPWGSASNEYEAGSGSEDSYQDQRLMETSFTLQTGRKAAGRSSIVSGRESSMPLVSLRPASSTDAWFILNLLSAVPFLSSLSYASTMEVLETARVDAYGINDVVVPADRRGKLLCVVWEGTCMERDKKFAKSSSERLDLIEENEEVESTELVAVWHAGDWTGPIALQPERKLSGESEHAENNDIVAMSIEGVKVITIEFGSLHNILKNGSALYRKYLERRTRQQQRRLSFEGASEMSNTSSAAQKLVAESLQTINVLDVLDQNSALRKLSAVQKRHLESLAEGPVVFGPGERLWRSGAPVDKAFLIVGGTASFVPRRRNAGSATIPSPAVVSSMKGFVNQLNASISAIGDVNEMQEDVQKAVEEMGDAVDKASDDTDGEEEAHIQLETLFNRSKAGRATSMTESQDFAMLSQTLMKRAESLTALAGSGTASNGIPSDMSVGSSSLDDGSFDSEFLGLEPSEEVTSDRRSSLFRRRSSRARFANKVLGRLYSRRAFTGGLVFSRGHFLGDVSKMVAGLLSSDYTSIDADGGQSFPVYGFGDKTEGPPTDSRRTGEHTQLSDMVIHEQDGEGHVVHTSTLTAGIEGCIVLVFPKATLIPFLDEYPGLLLSLLGTQVVV